ARWMPPSSGPGSGNRSSRSAGTLSSGSTWTTCPGRRSRQRRPGTSSPCASGPSSSTSVTAPISITSAAGAPIGKDATDLPHWTVPGTDERTLGKLLRRQAEERGDDLYLRFGEDRYTFGRANELANSLAGGFARLGVRPGSAVHCYLENSADYVLISFALAKLGAVCITTNTAFKDDFLLRTFAQGRADCLVVDEAWPPTWRGSGAATASRPWWSGSPPRRPMPPPPRRPGQPGRDCSRGPGWCTCTSSTPTPPPSRPPSSRSPTPTRPRCCGPPVPPGRPRA